MANITKYRTTKGENRYRVRYRKPDGTQTDKRGFRRKIDAENWAAEHVTIAKATNNYVDPEDGKRRVGDLYEQWLKEKWPFWKETTRVNATDSWRLYCEKRWSDRQVGTITRAEVQAWISDIIASAGAPSVSRPYQTMLGICRMAVRDKLILNNPCENVELPKLPRRKSRRVYLTISRLLAFADECARGKHLGAERRALVLTLGFCGLRWGEAAALKARDLDFDGGVLHSEEQRGTRRAHAAHRHGRAEIHMRGARTGRKGVPRPARRPHHEAEHGEDHRLVAPRSGAPGLAEGGMAHTA